jgi:hypothetical protein
MIGASEGNRIRFYDLMNIEDGFVQLMLTPSTSTRVVVAAHTLKLSEQNDLFYSGGGAQNRRVSFGTDKCLWRSA